MRRVSGVSGRSDWRRITDTAHEERSVLRGVIMKLKASGSSLLLASAINWFFVLLPSVGGVAQAQAAVFYVDGSLSASCSSYSIQLRNCFGSDGSAYTTIQQAVTSVNPGDIVYVRAGTYSLPANQQITLTTLCARSAP